MNVFLGYFIVQVNTQFILNFFSSEFLTRGTSFKDACIIIIKYQLTTCMAAKWISLGMLSHKS